MVSSPGDSDFFSHIVSFFLAIVLASEMRKGVCTQRQRRWLNSSRNEKFFKSEPQGREWAASGRGTLCMTTVQRSWQDAARGKAPANSGNKNDEMKHLPACFPTCTAGWEKSRRRDYRVCRGVGAYACLATVERRSARKKYDCLQFSRRCALVLS